MNLRISIIMLVLAALVFPIKVGYATHPELKQPKVAPLALGDGRIKLFDTHTGTHLEITYRLADGSFDTIALTEINKFLRCRYTGQAATMDPRVIQLVDRIQDTFGGGEVQIISGYRSPTLNAKLRSEGRRVAKGSLHMQGKAIDIRIAGVSTRKIYEVARKMGVGGVGYYASQNFVHVDTGKVRYW